MATPVQHVPDELLDDIRRGECLPVIGAGFSANAILPPGCRMPLWDDLGSEAAGKMATPYSGNAQKALSDYCFECTKHEMVKFLTDSLHVQTATPGDAHLAFAELPFAQVLTTNIDFLLERAWERCRRYYLPVAHDDLLSFKPRDGAIRLVKMHGDLHHPNSLVITEDDYARFQVSRPVMCGEVLHLLISRSLLFIGYSVGDPDFQQIWAIARQYLGQMSRPAYAILLGPSATSVNAYRRRGVSKVVSLAAQPSQYGTVLATLFRDIKQAL